MTVRTMFLEIRDTGTFVPAMATIIDVEHNDYPEWLVRRAGWALGARVIYLTRLADGTTQYDPAFWEATRNRTLFVAHMALLGRRHPEILKDRYPATGCLNHGDVIDVEYLLGLTNEPKISERLAGGA
jgi:hypothetical protein